VRKVKKKRGMKRERVKRMKKAMTRGVAPKSLRQWGLTRCCKQKREGGLGRRRSRRGSRRGRRRS
jgi:hypothetical protein